MTQPPTVLTIAALDLGIDRAINYMARVCNGWAVKDGRHQIQVKTTGRLDPSSGDNPNGAIAIAARNLDQLIRHTEGPKVCFGYSQGAQIAGAWLRRYAYNSDAPDPAELSFLLIGNPERRFGKQPWTVKTTPDDTIYHVRDVAREGDKWAQWNDSYPKNRIAAMFGGTHTNYWSTDPYGPDAKIVQTVGNTDYVVVP